MPQAIGYLRVSTIMQVEEGQSLDAQRAKIEAWAMLNDYELTAVHVDAGISGKRSDNRPGLQDALNNCRKGSALIVYSLSRLARSTKDTIDISERLAKSGADLVSLSEKIDTTSASGKMVFRMMAVLAEFERDQMAERVTMGMQHKKAMGGRIGTLPFGYQLADDGVRLIQDPKEQDIINVVRQHRETGLSLRSIVQRLAEHGYHSRTGQPFQLTQVARMVRHGTRPPEEFTRSAE